MKKILIGVLALLISVQMGAQNGGRPQGGAPQGQPQPKEVADALKALERAKRDAENVKRAANPATWLKIASAYIDTYEAPVKTLWMGASSIEAKLLLANQRVLSSKEEVVSGETMTVDTYSDKILYYDSAGQLIAWKITKEYIPGDLLQEAYNSIEKAIANDTKDQETKDIAAQLTRLKSLYGNNAMIDYTLGDYSKASSGFEKSYEISNNRYINTLDTTMAYYTAYTAFMTEDYNKATEYFSVAIDNGYEVNGDIYAYLADSYKGMDNIDKAKEVLNTGFSKYPNNQSVLVSLINMYMESGDDTSQVFDLIHTAQSNEPNNPSLYYAEGNVWKKMENLPNALSSYKKSTEIDAEYFYGFYALGAAYYDQAIEIQKVASNENDDRKYGQLLIDIETSLESAITPLEKAFELAPDGEIEKVIAEYLKNIYFRFREKSAEYMALYEKYNAMIAQ